MKKVTIIIIAIAFAIIMVSCNSNSSICPACNDKRSAFTSCPVCGMRVCESCADPYYYFESGEMEKYLRDQGYYVVSDLNEALRIIAKYDIECVIDCVEDHGYRVIGDG